MLKPNPPLVDIKNIEQFQKKIKEKVAESIDRNWNKALNGAKVEKMEDLDWKHDRNKSFMSRHQKDQAILEENLGKNNGKHKSKL